MKPELVDAVEWDALIAQIDADFGQGVSQDLLRDRAPVTLQRGNVKSYYLVPSTWLHRLEDDMEGFRHHFLGEYLADVSDGKVRLSLPILERLVDLTESIMIVSRRGAEAFTYGRSILKQSVIELNPKLKRGQRVLVLNEDRECLGLARLSIDASILKRLAKDKLVGKNLIDIGWYIRRLG
ncbi:MAG: PUA domain-containing protein [Candidatus Thorarchaeota archaeon]